uniref:Tick transposon n=1 Tax=Rhipicephalus appendiculatus TaxID=34631 RepID=A0A131YFQ7_RHIAP
MLPFSGRWRSFFPHPTGWPGCAPALWAPRGRAAGLGVPPHALGVLRVVVCGLPLACGGSCVGRAGGCVGDRTREHAGGLGKDIVAHLSAHCGTCSCVPRFGDVRILGRSHDKTARELLEAFYIKEKNDDCVSQTLVFLYNAEHDFFTSLMWCAPCGL